MAFWLRFKAGSRFLIQIGFQTWLSFVLLHQQEQEGKKFMEPRSEDDQFEEVTVQQLPQVKHTHSRVETNAGVCAETGKKGLGLIDCSLFLCQGQNG